MNNEIGKKPADPAPAHTPIFVHSLWRCASTYLFNVFRRSPHGYWVYQESIHEIAVSAVEHPDRLLDVTSAQMAAALRHPVLDTPYFQELFEVHAEWKDKIAKAIVYDQYFESECTPALYSYLSALITNAKGRPVFQECRTASRVAALKTCFGGVHIYAWRNPRDQWWSFKISDYFETAIQWILNAKPHPEAIERLRAEIGFQEFHSDDMAKEFGYFSRQRLRADHSYLVFYLVWVLGYQEGMKNADLCLSIDELGTSAKYRSKTCEQLVAMGVEGLDFSDCRVHQSHYSAAESDWFSRIEEHAQEILAASGWSRETITDVTDSLSIERTTRQSRSGSAIKEDLKRSRDIVLRLQDSLSHMATGFREDLRNKEDEHSVSMNTLKDTARVAADQAAAAEALHLEQMARLARREQELVEQVSVIQLQTARDVAEQARQHNEHVSELHRQHTETMDRDRRAKEEIMQTLARREQEFGAQILAVQRQAADEGAERTRQHNERLTELHRQHTEQMDRDRRAQEEIMQTLAQRQLEFSAQLLAVQQQAAKEGAEQARRHDELANTLQRQQDEITQTLARREQEFGVQLLAVRQHAAKEYAEQLRRHIEWERELDQRIQSALLDVRSLERERAEREQQYVQELLKIEQAYAISRREFDERLQIERETSHTLQQSLNALHIELVTIRSGLSWRLTAPLRGAKRLLFHPTPSQSSTQAVSPEPPASTLSTALPRPDSAASNLDALLELHGSDFVRCAYLTILKREPDSGGFGHYIQQLHEGTEKIELLSHLYASDEARASHVDLPWLRNAIRRRKIARLLFFDIRRKFLTSRR